MTAISKCHHPEKQVEFRGVIPTFFEVRNTEWKPGPRGGRELTGITLLLAGMRPT
jgi:hypothetical protein